MIASWQESYDKPKQCVKKQRQKKKSKDITLLTKVHIVKAMAFPVVMYRCESWTIKKAERRRTVVLEKTLESPLESKKIKPFNLKENQP